MKWEKTDKQKALEKAKSINFRPQDEREAYQFSGKTVYKLFENIYNKYTRWFFIVDDNDNGNICAIIALPRNGNMTFFANSNIKNKISFVKTLKDIANWYTDNYETTIFTKTASWYKEALQINKLIGFKKIEQADKHSIWVFEKDR